MTLVSTYLHPELGKTTPRSKRRQPAERVVESKAVTGERQQNRFVYQDDDAIEKPFNWEQIRRLGLYMNPYARQMHPVIVLTMLLVTLSKLAIQMLITFIIDHAISVKNNDMLFVAVSGMAAIYIVQWLAGNYRICFINIIGQKVIYDLRHELFSHIQRLLFLFFDKRLAGSVLVRVTNDINSLQELFTSGAVNVLIDCVQLAGIVVILLSLNFKLGLAIMATVPLMFFVR